MAVTITVAFALLFVGNAILSFSTEKLRETYADHVSGEVTVGAAGENSFSIFGSQQLLIGEYLVPPTLLNYSELKERVAEIDGVEATAGLVSTLARIRLAGHQADRTVFGVDFAEYEELFPGLQLIAGRFPRQGERGIVLQQPWSRDHLGQEALLAVARNSSFTLRGVPVTGIFSYPIEDQLLDRVVFVDADTARSLAGYIHGAADETELTAEQETLLSNDIDSFFGSENATGQGSTTDGDAGGSGSTEAVGVMEPSALLERLGAQEDARAARSTIGGAWNFLLLRLTPESVIGEVARELERLGINREKGYVVRDWQDSIGGTAQIVGYLQLFFSAGLSFVAFGAAIVAANALVLSVLERTPEIGAMRALGSDRGRIGLMISAESALIVVGAAVAGVLLGSVVVIAINGGELLFANQYLSSLFGGEALRGRITGRSLLFHLLGALVLTVVTVAYPLKRAVTVAPVEALSRW